MNIRYPRAASPVSISGQRPMYLVRHKTKAVSFVHFGTYLCARLTALKLFRIPLRRALPYASMCKGFALIYSILECTVVCANFAHITQHGALKGATQTAIIVAYNLDVISSVGYRVKSRQGTLFRQWVNRVLKDNVRTSATPKGFHIKDQSCVYSRYSGKTLKKNIQPQRGCTLRFCQYNPITLIPRLCNPVWVGNYCSRLLGVARIRATPSYDVKPLWGYGAVAIAQSNRFHDRFLIVDDTVYHIGASLKDLGKKLFAFSKMEAKSTDILKGV